MKTLLIFAATLLPAAGQITREGSVTGVSGGKAKGGQFQVVSATGQPPGATTAEGSGITIVSGFLGLPILLPLQDTDGDGLADELDSDNDGDAQTDVFEVLANTNHNDYNSRFSLIARPATGQGNVVVLVYEPTFPSRVYTVEWALELAPGLWAPLIGAETTVDGNVHVTKDENVAGPVRKFYRIRLERAP